MSSNTCGLSRETLIGSDMPSYALVMLLNEKLFNNEFEVSNPAFSPPLSFGFAIRLKNDPEGKFSVIRSPVLPKKEAKVARKIYITSKS